MVECHGIASCGGGEGKVADQVIDKPIIKPCHLPVLSTDGILCMKPELCNFSG